MCQFFKKIGKFAWGIAVCKKIKGSNIDSAKDQEVIYHQKGNFAFA